MDNPYISSLDSPLLVPAVSLPVSFLATTHRNPTALFVVNGQCVANAPDDDSLTVVAQLRYCHNELVNSYQYQYEYCISTIYRRARSSIIKYGCLYAIQSLCYITAPPINVNKHSAPFIFGGRRAGMIHAVLSAVRSACVSRHREIFQRGICLIPVSARQMAQETPLSSFFN